MAKQKLIRFEENEKFDRLFQPNAKRLLQQPHEFRGKWGEKVFNNDNPIVLELGCGRGEYTVGLAKLQPDHNFIGIDIKGSRLFHGVKAVTDENLDNAVFIRTLADFVDAIFECEISQIWITFPDPFEGKDRRKLTAPGFLAKYQKILMPNGQITLKTDDAGIYEFTLDLVEKYNLPVLINTNDLYGSGQADALPPIQTAYENKFLAMGKKIHLLRFGLTDQAVAFQ